MSVTRFICPSGHEVNINQCLKKCIHTQRCMFLPTLRAVANSLNRKLQNATVTYRIISRNNGNLFKENSKLCC